MGYICFICKKDNIYDECINCDFNNDIYVTLDYVKTRYKLTHNEIKNKIPYINLDYYPKKTNGNISFPGVRFNIIDVHKYAQSITINANKKSAKKKAFAKQDKKIEYIYNKLNKVEERHIKIIELLNLSIKNLYNHESIKLDNYDKLIKRCAFRTDIDVIEGVNLICKIISERYNRILELDTLINDINKDYVINHPKYHKYVVNGGDFEKISGKIKIDCSIDKIKSDNIKKINKFINNSFDNVYDKTLAKKTLEYNQYITCKISYSKCTNTIIKYINNIKSEKDRKQKLNNKINEKIKKKYINDAKQTDIYIKFVKDGNISSIDKIVDNLVYYFDRKDREKVVENLPYAVQKLAKLSDMYEVYLDGDIRIFDLTEYIGFPKNKLYDKWKNMTIGRINPIYEKYTKKIYVFMISSYDKIMWTGYTVEEMDIIRELCSKINIYTQINKENLSIALYK